MTSSKRWLNEHFSDQYVKQAQSEGYRSRAVYKLKEIDEKVKLLIPGMTVVDLGASPGGWAQYVARKFDGRGLVIALDCLPMDPLPGVDFIQGDFREEAVEKALLEKVPPHQVDVVLSDMAPNMSGHNAIDIPRAMDLAELALDFAKKTLKPQGSFFIKLFHGSGFDEFVKDVRSHFKSVSIKKPAASRSRSRETYLLARGYNINM